ncbi:hypothetical protein J6590_026080 [Homalodisca vitripennis]|nr:hypothetical protein J6590_026080 [Homalodisca vitripennis]
MRFFTDSIYRLIRELRIGKKSAFGVSKKLYDRGYPALLSQLFYIEKLKAYFNWVEIARDEAICSLLQNPTGIDDVIIDEYKSVTKKFGDLADEVKKRNESVIQSAEAVHKRGEPRFISLKFSLGKLKLHYNWGPREANYFEFLTMNARFKWQDFEEEFKNYTIERNT